MLQRMSLGVVSTNLHQRALNHLMHSVYLMMMVNGQLSNSGSMVMWISTGPGSNIKKDLETCQILETYGKNIKNI